MKKISLLLAIIVFIGSCTLNNELKGEKQEYQNPGTEIINIPPANTAETPYNALIKIGWKGIGKDGNIKGYWISWKSYFESIKDSVIQEAFFTNKMSMEIAFPSADLVNRHIFKVVAEDMNGKKDPVGAHRIFYTKKVLPPDTKIIFPKNNDVVFLMDSKTSVWQGIKIFVDGTTSFGKIQDYSIKLDNGEWSSWIQDSVLSVNKNIYPGLTEGDHTLYVRSRNNVLSFDTTPAELKLKFVKPTHNKKWLVVNDTKSQNGSLEKPSEAQITSFYNSVYNNIEFDYWDIEKKGSLSKIKIGEYQNIHWFCDNYKQTELISHMGIIIDYLNTNGNLFISGWNIFNLIDSKAEIIADSIKYYGDFRQKYLHYSTSGVVNDAKLSKIVYEGQDSLSVDREKLFSFRNGMYRVNYFTSLLPFVTPVYRYYPYDKDEQLLNRVIAYKYHNSEFRVFMCGFPLYFMTLTDAQKIIQKVNEHFTTQYPY